MNNEQLIDFARTYLQQCEDGELDKAARALADEVTLVSPGGGRFGSLEERAQASNARFRWVKKRIDRWDVLREDGKSTVYCTGTLYGEFPNGKAFEDVRFIDRFEIVEGQITLQEVWNDLGEVLRRSVFA